MAARGVAPLAALLLLAAIPSQAQAQAPSLVLASLEAGYGPEAWKDEAPVPALPLPGVPLPAPGALGVYENPYADPRQPHQGAATWLGYNLTAAVELRDGGGRPDGAAGQFVRARLETGAGTIPAKMTRVGEGRFLAQFDLDGENGKELPEAAPGLARLVAEAFQPAGDPTVAPTRVASAEFWVQVWPAGLDRGVFAFPEGRLPGYADAGRGNTTLVEAPAPAQPFEVLASLGAPGAPAVVAAWHRAQRTVLVEGPTDAAGRLRAVVDPAQVAGANRTGLVVVEAHLEGADGRLASASFALSVGAPGARVVRYEFEGRSLAGQPLSAADVLLVGVEDPPAAGERAVRGSVHAVDEGGAELAGAPFDPTSFGPGSEERVARLPALNLARGGLTSYRVVGILLAEDGRLHALGHAMRGFGASAPPAHGRPFEAGALEVVVRNFNNNLDDRRDPGMALPVRLEVTGLPGGAPFLTAITVEESAEGRVEVPFRGDQGDYALGLNVSSGEFFQSLRATLRIAPPDAGFLGLPDAEAPLLLAALAGLALAQRRRTRS